MASHSKWIRTERAFLLPSYVREALQLLDDRGHVAYVVGGSVRDFLLGRECKDHDIATSASPDELCALFPEAVLVGKAFGVIKIPLQGEKAQFLEIAAFREDLDYEDHRHPRGVRFAGVEEDAARRDFTINALYYDPKSSQILDCTGGLPDLRGRVIRAIGEPRERFREDALRLLRAVRFANALDFQIESHTEAAIRSRARLIHHVSGERIRDELTSMLHGPRVADAMKMLGTLGLLEFVLPEVQVTPALLGALRWLERELPTRNPQKHFAICWALLIQKSEKGDPTEAASVMGRRLKFARTEIDQILAAFQDLPKFKEVFQMREATLLRFLQQPGFEASSTLHKILALAGDGNLAYHEYCSVRLESLRKAHPDGIPRVPKLIDGQDLIQLGFSPGPEFSAILRVVEDLALEKKLLTQAQALEYVVHHFVK